MNVIKPKPTKEFLKYTFAKEELFQKGNDLARMNSELRGIESERKAVAASFKAKEELKQKEIDEICNHVNNGYEHRYIDCEIRYNDPNTGMKSIFRKDNGELVRKESMTEEELQLELQFEN